MWLFESIKEKQNFEEDCAVVHLLLLLKLSVLGR